MKTLKELIFMERIRPSEWRLGQNVTTQEWLERYKPWILEQDKKIQERADNES